MHTNVRKSIARAGAACLVCGLPVAVALAGAGTSAAATAKSRPAGTSYVATTTDGGVNIVLSRDRRQVRRALFAYKQKCNDGDTVYDYDVYRAIPVGANRKFSYSYDTGPQASTTTPGATFSYTGSFDGTVNKAGTKIVGTARATFTYANPAGGSYSCDSGTVQFKAAD